ncbi:MAG: His/Gly/Thr/Pro-type tRNA ligase C-terminal domain-containing protein, partial [Planctomycetaceae bacterium]|nr:His/Gly/Thr/Pro-type tRNA ligase C-terminal domain-containing protein [Planctomycetaceae bacterium]
DLHFVGVNAGRDYTPTAHDDFRNAVAGDTCPECGGTYETARGIEVGHIFKLGTKYSEALGAKFLDTNETQKTIIMGCYGIGVNRILVGVCETSIDESGIIWPVALAPYEVVITPLKTDETSMSIANQLCEQLETLGVDCLIDDRDQRAGVKFKDADLIGFPLRIVLGPKGLENGEVEVKWRWDKSATMLPLTSAAETLAAELSDERRTNKRFRRRGES